MSMRKLIFAFLLLFIPSFAVAEISSIDNGYMENISAFGVIASMSDNGEINVVEDITYDFGSNEKHGIYRYIPVVYKGRTGSPRQKLNIISVKNGEGKDIEYTTNDENSSQVVQIGNEDKLVTGIYKYKIEYTLSRMISTGKDGDRFRWDAIGIGWNVPINNILITLNLSDEQLQNIEVTRCYIGSHGSTNLCDFEEIDNQIRISEASISTNTGITIDTLFKSSTFPAPSKLELWIWQSNWYYLLPFIAFTGFFLLWFEKGRDPKGRGTIVPMYDAPKGITPFEASIILEDMITKKALPAAIISLAIAGYIKIHRKEVKIMFTHKPEYELELLKPLPESASTIDKKVIDMFFISRDRVNLKKLDDSFVELNQALHKKAYKEVTLKGYYVVNPTISRIIFFSVAVTLIVFGILSAVYFLLGPLGYLCFLLPGIIGFFFAFIMPVKTKAGAILKEDLLGLKMYIRTAEIDRIKFHNAPAKSPEKFEELLPYAIIFGLEKQWAGEFKNIYSQAPDWYDGNFATFSTVALVHDLNNFSDITAGAIASSSVNSSGGFGGVGGGGGGGGGGSW